jgi:hypothetical protein
MSSDVPVADTCVCGATNWHKLVGGTDTEPSRVLWCRRCGAIRLIFEEQWQIPLDRAGDMPRSLPHPPSDDERPTDPGTPVAKRSVPAMRVITTKKKKE